MNDVMKDLWPFLTTTLLATIVGYARYVHNLQSRVAVLENTIEKQQLMLSQMQDSINDLQSRVATLEKALEDQLKTLDNMQKRMDSHSKKQDDILERITSMEKEVLKQMGVMGANIASLASDLKGFSNMIAVSDIGLKINRT